jgi:hypothetical protein
MRVVQQLVTVVALGIASPAGATLVGDQIDLSLDFVDPQHIDEVALDQTVAAGDELLTPFFGPLNIAAGSVAVDVADASIALELVSFSEASRLEPPFLPAFSLSIDDLDLIGAPGFVIVGIEADPGNDPGFSATFEFGTVLIEFAGIPPSPDNPNPTFAEASFTLETVFVPEPGVASLVCVGLAVLARGRTRRRRG